MLLNCVKQIGDLEQNITSLIWWRMGSHSHHRVLNTLIFMLFYGGDQ